MAAERSGNEGFHIVEEFVCTAIPGPWQQQLHAGGSNGADQQPPKPESTGDERTGNVALEANEDGDKRKSP